MTILFWANEPFFKVYETIQFWGVHTDCPNRHIFLWASSESAEVQVAGWNIGTNIGGSKSIPSGKLT